MKTQVSVYVKNESIISRFFSLTWFIDIFRGSSISAYIDGDESRPVKMKASKKPYSLELAPGVHEIYFADNQAKSKNAFNAITGVMLGGALGLGAGGTLMGGTVGAVLGAHASDGPVIDNGAIRFQLQEGENLGIAVKPKRNGAVKIHVL